MTPVILSLGLLLAAPASPAKPLPPKPAKSRLAVLDIQNLVGVTPELARGLTAALVVAVRKAAPDSSVISTEEIKAMLAAERTKQQLGCAEASCLAEIGGALGASKMLAGQLGKFGSTYLLTVKLIDVRRATVEQEAAESIQGQEDDALLGAVKRITRKLFPANFNSDDELEVNSADLWGTAPPPARGNTRALAWVLGGAAVASAALAVVSFIEVKSWNDKVAGWNAQLAQGTVPGGVTSGSAGGAHSDAVTFQVLGFSALSASVLTGGGAALLW